MPKLETVDIKDVQIFAAGTWNGDAYTVRDLDEMVAGYIATKDALKPYLKLGHDDKQKLAQKDGYPAIGWVENLRRVGDKLVADFKHVPKKLAELMQAGAYRRVSSEIFTTITVAGQKFKNLLKAVGILGADTPAVENLNDIIALYDLDFVVTNYGADDAFKTYEIEADDLMASKDKEERMDTIEVLKAKVADLEAKLKVYADKEAEKATELEQKVDDAEKQRDEAKAEADKAKADATAAQEKVNQLEAAVKQHEREKAEAETTAVIEKLVAEKKIVPAQKEAAFALLMNAKDGATEKKFKVGEKELNSEELVMSFFSNGIADVHTDQDTGAGIRVDGIDLDVQARKYMEANKGVTYAQALVAVSPAELPEAKPLGDE